MSLTSVISGKIEILEHIIIDDKKFVGGGGSRPWVNKHLGM